MIDINEFKNIVCDSINNHPDIFLSPRKKWEKITSEMINSRNRNREIVEARQFCHYMSKILYPKMPLIKIGNEFGGVDHASVIHSRKRITELLKIDNRTEAIWIDISFILAKRIINNT
jgi:chromosomal replication initiation ATPase DnaA